MRNKELIESTKITAKEFQMKYSKGKKESDIQKSIINILKINGFYTIRFNSGAMMLGDARYFRAYILPDGTSKGLPDLLVHKDGKTCYIECKRLNGKLRESQKKFMSEITRFGIQSVVLDNIDDALNFVKMF